MIDADSIVYILAWNARESTDERVMELNLDQFMVELIQVTQATHYLGVFSPKKTFRNEIYQEYKANRPPSPDYIVFWKPKIIQACIEKYGFFIAEKIEADDVLSIMREYKIDGQDTEVIFCSPDKDLKQIPGKHYDYQKKQWLEIDTYEADRRFWTQMLVGDTSDNVPGCKGIGEKTAPKILAGAVDRHDMELRVKEAYATNKKYPTPDYGSVQYCVMYSLLCLSTPLSEKSRYFGRFVQEVAYSDAVLDELEQLNTESNGQDSEVLRDNQRSLEGDILCAPSDLSEQV